MPVKIESAPAVITEFKAPRGAGHKADGEQPAKLRLITIDVDVTNSALQKAIGEVFPGFDMAIKAAASANDGSTKSSAFTWQVSKKLPNVTVSVRNKLDEVVFAASNVKVKSKPVLRVSLGVEKVLMPLTLECPVDDVTLKAVVDYIDYDVILDLSTAQMEISTTTTAGSPDAGKTTNKKGGKGKAAITLVGSGD